MIRGMVAASLNFRFLVVVIALTVIGAGVAQLREMPMDVLPEFAPPYVEIQTEALGLSAEEVEQMITAPLEQDLLAGVAWADVIHSKSVPGLSSVVIFFEPGTDIFRARQMVSERLAQAVAGLPRVSKPPTMIQPLSSSSRFIIIGLSSPDLSLIEMSVLTRWTIGPRLLSVPGVANIAVWGQRERQLQVLVNPERLRAQGVSLDQVVATTGNALWMSPLSYLQASTPGTGGFIDTPNQRLGIWHVLPIASPADLAQVPVEGAPALTLADVAELVEDHQPLIGDAVIGDAPNLLLVVEKLPGANTLEVTKNVEAALEALRPGLSEVTFDATLFRPATFIELALDNLSRGVLIGAVLMALSLSAFFYGWRAALISLIVIPLSLITTLLVLYLLGATLNILVLAGLVIALGVVVDEAIVDVEQLRQRLHQMPPTELTGLITEIVQGMRGALFFAMLSMVLTTLPVFFIAGTLGALLQPLMVTYALAVVVAMLVALTVTPALSLILLAHAPTPPREFPLAMWLQQVYARCLAHTLQAPRWTYLALVLLLIAGVVLLPLLKPQQALPTLKEPYLLIQLESTLGISRPAMVRLVTNLSEDLRTLPGVQNVGAHVGRAVFGDQIVDINSAQLWVHIRPQADHAATMMAVQELVNNYVGLKHEVITYLQQTLNQTAPTTGAGLTVRVLGENWDTLQGEADKVRQVLSEVPGVTQVRVELPQEELTLKIEVNLAAAQAYGIKPGDVRRAAAILLSGLQVGALFEEQKVFDVVVWGTPKIRQSLTDVAELLIETPKGYVRLGDVATVQLVPAPVIIQREGVSPYLDVAFAVQAGQNPDTVVQAVQTAIRNIPFSLEYHATVRAAYMAEQTEQQRGWLAAGMMLLGIFLLIHAVTDSWRLTLTICVALMAALVGGMGLALMSKEPLTLTTLFGLLAVFGLATRHSLLLVQQCRNLAQSGHALGAELVAWSADKRFIPTVMTTLTTGLALLPFVLMGDQPGLEVVRPIALVILGGLVTSTLTTLFVVPVLYLQFGPRATAEMVRLSLDIHFDPSGAD